MKEQIKAIFDKRLENIKMTVQMKEPEYVPIVSDMIYWPLSYSGVKLEEILGNPDKHCAAFIKVFDALYTDAISGGGISASMEVIRTLGVKNWFISDDGITVQHDQNCVMEAEEYLDYASNPSEYQINTLAPCKFNVLNGSAEEIYQVLKKRAKNRLYIIEEIN